MRYEPAWISKADRPLISALKGFAVSARGQHVHLLEFSSLGCRLEYLEKPQIGELVWIKLPGLESFGSQVCWVRRQFAGARYFKALEPAVLDMLMARLCTADALMRGAGNELLTDQREVARKARK